MPIVAILKHCNYTVILSQLHHHVVGNQQAAEKVIFGSATPISAKTGVGSCAPRSGMSNTYAPVLVASLAWAACAPQLSTPFFITLLGKGVVAQREDVQRPVIAAQVDGG